MADHVSEQIIAAAVAALTGLATTGARVYDSRVHPLQDAEVAAGALLVDQGDESDETLSIGADRLVEREMELLVVAKVKQTASYRATINQIRKEVEVQIAQDDTLGGKCKYINPRRGELELAGDGEKPVASYTMVFSVVYVTALNAPDISL
jgi:hypothetical protein